MIQITPTRLKGKLVVQPSKSYLHRAIICGALSGRHICIDHINQSEDVMATLRGVAGLGLCTYALNEDGIELFPVKNGEPQQKIDAGESGSTLRFLLPLALTMGKKITFTGTQRLMERPLSAYGRLCAERGFLFEQDRESVSVCGRLRPGEYTIPADLSSQFATGLLLALSQEGESKVVLEGRVESLPYIQITLDVLSWFGVDARLQGNVITLGGGYNAPQRVRIPGDWSAAANFAVAGALGGGVSLAGLSLQDAQGDRVILDILKSMGAKFRVEEGKITFEAAKLRGRDIDASQCPDLVPILAVALALSQGQGSITNAGRLRLKESDRLDAITQSLCGIGGQVEQLPQGLIVTGQTGLSGGEVGSAHDHRIAMAIAMAAGFCQEAVCIDDEACVKKSAPDFWQEFKQLGGKYVCRK